MISIGMAVISSTSGPAYALATMAATSVNETDTVGPVSAIPISVSYATLMALGSRRDVATGVSVVCSLMMPPVAVDGYQPDCGFCCCHGPDKSIDRLKRISASFGVA